MSCILFYYRHVYIQFCYVTYTYLFRESYYIRFVCVCVWVGGG